MAEDWTDALPRALKSRFDGMSNYVAAVLQESGQRKGLSRFDIQRIQIAAFLKALDEFLADGTDAAIHAVDALTELDVEGFTVGSELFEGRNNAVLRGARLSASLREAVGVPSSNEMIGRNTSLRELIVTMAREARRAGSMGRRKNP